MWGKRGAKWCSLLSTFQDENEILCMHPDDDKKHTLSNCNFLWLNRLWEQKASWKLQHNTFLEFEPSIKAFINFHIRISSRDGQQQWRQSRRHRVFWGLSPWNKAPRSPKLKHEALYFSWRQARNQLGTAGGAKSFLRGAQIFWTISNSFKLSPIGPTFC